MNPLGRRALAGLVAALWTSSGVASETSPIDCMAQSYDPEQLAQIEELDADFLRSDAQSESSGGFEEVTIVVTAGCAYEHGWNEDQIHYAMLYEGGRLGEAAYRKAGPLSAEQLAKLDAALAKRDNTEMWKLMERAVVAGVEGVEVEFTKGEEMTLGLFIIGSGLGMGEDVGENVGSLLGLMAMQRYAQREFEAIETQE